ncbi:MAG: aromatic amino acid transport family protein [Parachlamydiales bacterium]|jgi:tyrosine-specific transport protein
MSNLKLIPGSIFGGMLLIAGCCIGAGMLGLPILLGLCGFMPSMLLLFASWIFMTFTGLLLVEINGWFYEQVNIISMSKKALGPIGQAISWILYLSLFYSLGVAYISGGGKIFFSFFPFFGSSVLAIIFFVAIFASLVFLGTKIVDFSNRLLMVGLVVSYLIMTFLAVPKINSSYFTYVNMKYFLSPLPVLITSFGFHNMIPSLTAYMKGDLKRTKIAIIGGSAISLIIYFFWVVIVLGIIPLEGENGLREAFLKGNEATIPLRNILKSKIIISFAGFFAFFAIVTSFLTQTLGLTHFLADGLKIKINSKNNWWLILLAVVPSTVFSLIYPDVFFKALDFAGAYCAVILFGILPALMAWIGRYITKETSIYHVRGGKLSLIVVFLFSFIIILSQLLIFFGF